MEYVAVPELEDRVLIVSDPMLATGSSMVLCIKELMSRAKFSQIHIVSVIGSTIGVQYVQRNIPKAHIWIAAIDDELTTKSYIVPGLGDAGDLAFGEKVLLIC
jgi:uracil phosphoribosyltransferase